MSKLDEAKLYDVDTSGMLAKKSELGRELIRAWGMTEEIEVPAAAERARNVVIAGMGGSATAGDYFAALCTVSAEVPVTVVRGYALPNYVSEQTLVVLSSYSGDTEESLSAYDDAWQRGASIIATTKGGKLGGKAREAGVPVHEITYEAAPRAALAHSLAPLLRIGSRLGLVDIEDADIREAGELHEDLVLREIGIDVQQANNPAKQLAEALHGKVPFVIGAEHLSTVASRFKNQIAENGKALGAADVLPEADHNLIVGLGTGREAAQCLSLVTLESDLYDPRVQKRFDVTTKLFEDEGVPVHRIKVGGDTLLTQMLQGTAWGDFISCYVALLNGIDPTPVPQIVRLKEALAQ